MRRIFTSVIALFLVIELHGQCNTDLIQFIPDRGPSNDDRFGVVVDANDKFLVTGATNSDTLGLYYSGSAYVWEKTPAGWAYRAMLLATGPKAYDFFGSDVAIDESGNTIVVIDRRNTGPRVSIYEKPVSGWETMLPTAVLTSPFVGDVPSVDISADGNTIALGLPTSRENAFLVFRKPASGWQNSVLPEVITSPEATGFGHEILISGPYIYVSTNYYTYGRIFVYKMNGPVTEYLGKLSLPESLNLKGHFGKSISGNEDMVAVVGMKYVNGIYDGTRLFIFRKEGEWKDASPAIERSIPFLKGIPSVVIEFVSPTELVASGIFKEGTISDGNVFHVKASDQSWSDISIDVIYQEPNIATPSNFGLDLAWNGSDLLMGAAIKPSRGTGRNAVLSLTRSAGLWGSSQLVTIDRYNSGNFNLGTAVLKVQNTLLAGAPGDNAAGDKAGAVYVYEKSGDDFVRTHKILPSLRNRRPDGGRDAAFGYSLASHGDDLAIGAPYFRYSGTSGGKIFLYRKTGSSWSTAELYDSLSAPDSLLMTNIGYTLAMNDHVIFASAFNNSGLGGEYAEEEHQHAVLVYEKIDGEWKYQHAINLGKPIAKRPSLSLSLHEDVLVAGSFASVNGGVYVIIKNPENGKWQIQARFVGDTFENFGQDVKVTENHLFIGVPREDYQGVESSGCVLVYAKVPGQQWHSGMVPVRTIGAETPIVGGYFGGALDVIGNTLVVGAPGGSRTIGGVERTIPGSVYIIQTQDYFWKNTVQFLTLQGKRYAFEERDYFGYDVAADRDNFFIGAAFENTSVGSFSGAVYTIPTPPLIYLSPPVCQNDLVRLQGYPFNGTWSGPGIEDPSGVFDPGVTGTGTFLLTYTTPNCAYEGKYQIEVREGPEVNLISPTEIQICSEASTLLEVAAVPGATYQWFYKSASQTDYSPAGMGTHQKMITRPGKYMVTVFDSYCPTASPVIDVSIREFELSIGPQPVVCSHHENVKLVVSDHSGTWEGPGILNNVFNSGTLANGTYELTYRFTTPEGCKISIRDSVAIAVVEPFNLRRGQNDFCEEGYVTLYSDQEDTSLNFNWYYSADNPDDLFLIEKELQDSVVVYQQGYYRASASNGTCIGNSAVFNVGFTTDLPYRFTHEGDSISICNEQSYKLVTETRPGSNLLWSFRPENGEAFSPISEASPVQEMNVSASGAYKVSGAYGFCTFESGFAWVELRNDSIWAPNVFTPNGDGFNETFAIVSDSEEYAVAIFNRYGKKVYERSGVVPYWDGGDASSGVYYYNISYPSCNLERKEIKGWVHLLR